jgi:hypothetical protein
MALFGMLKQGCGSAFILYGSGSRDLMTENGKNVKAEIFLYQTTITYPLASIKDVQVTKEAFSSQKRTSNTSKHEISFFSTFVGHFCPLGSGFRIRIRIH